MNLFIMIDYLEFNDSLGFQIKKLIIKSLTNLNTRSKIDDERAFFFALILFNG